MDLKEEDIQGLARGTNRLYTQARTYHGVLLTGLQRATKSVVSDAGSRAAGSSEKNSGASPFRVSSDVNDLAA
jgi:hypothetical protein